MLFRKLNIIKSDNLDLIRFRSGSRINTIFSIFQPRIDQKFLLTLDISENYKILESGPDNKHV